MGDVPVGAIDSSSVTVVPASPPAVSTRAAKLDALIKSGAVHKPQAATSEAKPTSETIEGTKEPIAAEKPAEGKLANAAEVGTEEKPAEKAEHTKSEDADPETAKRLAQIEKQAKKFRDEQAAERKAFQAEMAQARADFARERAEHQAKYTPVDELAKIAKRDPIAALSKLGYQSEEDWEVVGRAAFPLTKAGKADPRTKDVADRVLRDRGNDDKVAALEAKIDELTKGLTERDQRAQGQAYVQRFLDGAIKAIPATPTLIGIRHANSPDNARQALHEIGARLERDNDGVTPTHAEVIAEYERQRRAELEEQGVDVDSLLKPAATTAKAPAKTLDVTSTTGTRPINGTPTKEEKLAAVYAERKRRESAQL